MDTAMTCEEFHYRAWQQPVSLPTAERMKRHADNCTSCAEHLEFVATRIDVTSGFPKVDCHCGHPECSDCRRKAGVE